MPETKLINVVPARRSTLIEVGGEMLEVIGYAVYSDDTVRPVTTAAVVAADDEPDEPDEPEADEEPVV